MNVRRRAHARSIPGYRQLFERVMASSSLRPNAVCRTALIYLIEKMTVDSSPELLPALPTSPHLHSYVHPRLSAG